MLAAILTHFIRQIFFSLILFSSGSSHHQKKFRSVHIFFFYI